MNKTLSIALAGFSFTIEEHAYIKLSDYLSALRSSLDASEADEIMHDIEIRIVEILKENMAKREVVNDEDIEKVIAQIGKPEVIEEQEEAYYSDNQFKKSTKTRFSSNEYKQLFRDPENQKIGGVCSGLGTYFDMDITWMRVIWVALFLVLIPLPGSPVVIPFIYIVLWIVLPKAQSASDYLKLKGKPVNFDNLKEESSKIVQFANESTAKVGEMFNETKPIVKQTGNGLWNVIRFFLGGIFGVIGLGLLFSALTIFGAAFNSDIISLPGNLEFYLQDGWLKYLGIAFAFLSVFVPCLIFLFLSIKLISPKTKFNHTGYVFGSLIMIWFLLLGALGMKAIKYKTSYRGTNEEKENILINTKSDSILIDIKKVLIPQNFKAYGDDVFSDLNTVYEEDYPSVDVTRKEGNFTPYLIIKKEADGYNIPLNLKVPVEVNNNTIFLPNYISYLYENKMRDYRVSYELVVPQNKKVIPLNEERGFSIHDDTEEEKTEEVNGKININGSNIEFNSDDADSVIINGKKYPKEKADSIINNDLKEIKELKDLKNLKDLNISIKDGESKIEINTKK